MLGIVRSIYSYRCFQPSRTRVSIARRFFNSKNRVHIPAHIREKLFNGLISISGSPYCYKNLVFFRGRAAQVLTESLPRHIVQAIFDLHINENGFLEITGTPTDPILMDTPKELEQIVRRKQTFIPELFCLGISGLLNRELYNFHQEAWGTGNLIFNIFPTPDKGALKGAGGVKNNFGFHMENAWHPKAPDFVLLKGIRQDHDKKAITYVASNREIDANLFQDARELLRKEIFCVFPPEIHKKMEEERGILFANDMPYKGPVIIEEKLGLKFMLNLNGTIASDKRGENALREVEKVAYRVATKIRLRHDNMLIINNNRAVHTRNGYSPRYDGKDRWFQRYYLIQPGKLWDCPETNTSDFPFLSKEEALELIGWFHSVGILIKSKLNCVLNSQKEIHFEFPEKFLRNQKEIVKILVRKGPVYPERVV